MRFRLTIFLIIANAALFFGIWSLERQKAPDERKREDMVNFSMLKIEGKSIDKPRVLKLENNHWRIVSPIEWPANLFAVNRIKNQIEFLDKEANFSLDEVKKHGHSLAEYGLDDPAYVFQYGNGEKMYTLKIGKTAPIGDRIYLLDEKLGKIIVVDKEFVENLVLDMERLRNQMVFEIPRFEVSSFSVRLPVETSDATGKTNFRRIGIQKEGLKWKFETPIVADADPREVDVFLTDICQLSANSFTIDPTDNTGFDISTLPVTITLQGTNRRQVLLLGNKTKNGKYVYAHLENNPTIFTLEASLLKKLNSMQTSLRDKSFLRFDVNQTVGIDISKNGKTLKLRKLKSGVWDVIGSGEGGETLTASADLALVNNLLMSLEKVRARQFINDVPGETQSEYGLSPTALHIVATQSDQSLHGIVIGSTYKLGGASLMYASADGSEAVYGITRELSEAASTDFLYYRSRVLEILPEKAVINSLKISEINGTESKVVFEIAAENGDFKNVLAKLPTRQANAANALLAAARKFSVENYLNETFSKDGVRADGKTYPWRFIMEVSVDLPGTAEAVLSETRSWYFSKRIGGNTQYGGSQTAAAVYTVPFKCIDALFELTQEITPPKEAEKPVAVPPSPTNSLKTQTTSIAPQQSATPSKR